jgi:hypothetical protein
MMQPPFPTALDLFCGCGGFSLVRSGFQVLATVDFNKETELPQTFPPSHERHHLV